MRDRDAQLRQRRPDRHTDPGNSRRFTTPSGGGCRPAVEAYVLDHDDLDVRGEQLAVDFIARLREPMRFSSIDELATQIRKDAAVVRWLLIT